VREEERHCDPARRGRPATLVKAAPGAHHARMPRVDFTPQLRRFTETPSVETGAATLREALDDAFTLNPRLRGYVLDDQGHLRANVVVFIDGQRIHDRVHLGEALRADSRIHVLQALSGG
jgi:sulfur carrier protein ThiS